MKRVLLILIPLGLLAQKGWMKIYGGSDKDDGYWVEQTTDGGYIIAGTSFSFGGAWLLKTDSEGDTLWTRTYEWSNIYQVQQTQDGGYLGVGTKQTGVTRTELLIIKTDKNGHLMWERQYGPEEPRPNSHACGFSVQQIKDGRYIVTGELQSTLWLLKTDSSGDTLWTRSFDGSEGRCVQQTNDGNFIITGYKGSWKPNLCLLKVDPQGNLVWSHTYTEKPSSGSYVQETEDGGYVITGVIEGSTYVSDLWLLKTDSEGNMLWNRAYGAGEYAEEGGEVVRQTDDGGYIVIGFTEGFGSGLRDLWLLRTDPEGDTLWSRTFGGVGTEEGRCIKATSDKGYIMVGHTASFGKSMMDIMLIKVDSSGGGIPLKILPTKVVSPIQSWWNTPEAYYTNLSTEDYPYELYCHCEIIGLNNHNYDYHDSVLVVGLEGFETAEIEFEKWITQDIDNYEALFYITSPKGPSFPTDTMTRTFYWDPLQIEDQPVAEPGFEVINAFGREIVLRYTDSPKGFHASIFDASGRKVDELYSNRQTGTIRWGEGQSPGVYFIRPTSGDIQTQKVILVK